MDFSLFSGVFILVLGLLGIGFYGLLAARNLIKVIVALQLLIKGVIVIFIMAAHYNNQIDLGQSVAFTIIVADTIVAVIGLALAVQVRKHIGTLDLKKLTTLRR